MEATLMEATHDVLRAGADWRRPAGFRGRYRTTRAGGARLFYDTEAEAVREGPEQWRPVPRFVHRYLASSFGRVWSVQAADFLRPFPNRDGYLRVDLRGGGKRWHAYVHHVVLWAFSGPRPEGFQAHHENGDQRDNRLKNLRWVERSRHEAYHSREDSGDPLATTQETLTGKPVDELADEAPF